MAERKETGRVSNGRIRIKRKIKVNAFRRLCRRWMNGSIAFVINGVSKPFTLGKYQHFSIDYFLLPFPFSVSYHDRFSWLFFSFCFTRLVIQRRFFQRGILTRSNLSTRTANESRHARKFRGKFIFLRHVSTFEI